MKSFTCRICGNALYFENSVCVSCGTSLGYSRAEHEIVPVDDTGTYTDTSGGVWHVCANLNLSGCTWLTPTPGGLCFSCSLTRTRPNDADAAGIAEYPVAERAKRQLIAELDRLGFPVIGKVDTDAAPGDPAEGLAFDLLSSAAQPVVTGQENGVVTIDLAESDDAYREQIRDKLDEPYRTMLGHFRHEVGHYYEWLLVRGDERMARSRELFGDESADYQAALDRHYASGPPDGWQDSFISAYATMHPFEDFAETWAHYLHICDTVETAAAYGLISVDPIDWRMPFRQLVTDVWVPLSTALNMINRSMGKDDLYPFVIAGPVLDKLDFVASLRPLPLPVG
ncbi:zinc-binding metallopeptidase family protein [Gryllotalpicola koreensis]|uniref:Zinc-binding metallopeptidase n=1 Tax=Gryllotalpicola koreensis TaxID=993086 RepID=A0ABP8A3Q4_9MICO